MWWLRLFPTVFGVGAFVYVSGYFPAAGWSYFAAPAERLVDLERRYRAPVWRRTHRQACTRCRSCTIGAALVLSAPVAIVALAWVIRRRPLIAPPAVFVAALITASMITVATGLFGDPTALAVAAPVLAALVMIRTPIVRERLSIVVPLLAIGWVGGILSLALIDPATATRISAR